VNPSVLRETSQEVHDEYVKKFGKLPDFKSPESGAGGAQATGNGLKQQPNAPGVRSATEVKRIQATMDRFTEMLNAAFEEDDAEFPLAEHVSKPDEPEDVIEQDNTKIDQILAAVNSSSAVKLNIPEIEDGNDGVTYIEQDVDEYNVSLFKGSVAMVSKDDKCRDVTDLCVGTAG
jgi:hypothetical protein